MRVVSPFRGSPLDSTNSDKAVTYKFDLVIMPLDWSNDKRLERRRLQLLQIIIGLLDGGVEESHNAEMFDHALRVLEGFLCGLVVLFRDLNSRAFFVEI